MLITGKNAVYEALRSDATVEKLYVQRGETTGVVKNIIALAKEKKIVVSVVDKTALDRITQNAKHQGVALTQTEFVYSSLDDILSFAKSKDEPPFIVILDELSDPHNLGAVIRTAECAGAHGVVIPKRRSAGLTAIVAKTSAGAVSHIPVARVPNLTALMKELQKRGVWIFGAEMNGNTSLYEADLKGPAAIVIGSEGSGMSRLVAETCDFTVSIPMKGKINSLNASAAAAILLYEAVRQRLS